MTTATIKFDPYATIHLVNERTSYVPVNFQKSKGQPGGKLKPCDSKSTRLQELSIMNSTYVGNIHYDIHLDMKLDYTISRIFQEMSLSELETLHQLCELERTQILQSLALAVLKYLTQDTHYQEIYQVFLVTKETFYSFTLALKKYHHFMFLKTNVVKIESPYSIKMKYILSTHFHDEHIFGIRHSYVDQKKATM